MNGVRRCFEKNSIIICTMMVPFDGLKTTDTTVTGLYANQCL